MAQGNDLAFLRLLYTSGIDPIALMPVASACLRRLVPAFSLSMIRVNADCAPQEHYSEFFDEFSHQLFASAGHHFAAASNDPASFGNLLRSRNPIGNLIDTPQAYLNGATYQMLFQRNGIHHCLDVAVRDLNGPLAILGIFREQDAMGFSRKDLAAVTALYPFLVHAFAAKPLPADFDEIDSALLMVGLDGTIQWASPQARAWLEDATPSVDRVNLMTQGILPRACRHLCQLWVASQSPRRRKSDTGQVPTLTLPLAGGQLRMRAYGLSSQLPGGDQQPACIGIQLSLEMHRGLRVLHVLEHHRLTPQQKRIAFALWRGDGAADIRETLGLSLHTLKSYQKELYARMSVSGAVDLIRRLNEQASQVVFNLQRHQPRVA